jgi:hypothetical protein
VSLSFFFGGEVKKTKGMMLIISTAITESAVVHKEMKALKAQIDRLERLISEGPEDKKGKDGEKKGGKEALKDALVDTK